MDGRRPRIKPTVNLQPKRKLDSSLKLSQKEVTSLPSSINLKPNENSTKKLKDIKLEATENYQIETSKISDSSDINIKNNSFKKPIDIQNNTNDSSDNTSIIITDLNLKNEVQENSSTTANIFQSSNNSKQHRQRIKPTPFFTQGRRNSLQGSSNVEFDQQQRSNIEQKKSQLNNESKKPGNQSIIQIQKNYITSGEDTSEFVKFDNEDIKNVSNIEISHSSSKYRKVSTSEDFQTKLVSQRRSNNCKKLLRQEKSTMKMFDFIYFNPSTNPMISNKQTNQEQKQLNESNKDKSVHETQKNVESELSPTSTSASIPSTSSAVPVPQLKLDSKGEVIIDEQSLIIETTSAKEGRENLKNSDIIYLDDNTGNNGFYKRHKRTKDWSSEETIKFYRCLQTVGTDFSLMLTLFPNRNRRDLKLKFKKEEKNNLRLINKALLYPKKFNIEELKLELDIEEQKIQEKRRKLKELQSNQKNIKKDPVSKKRKSKVQRELTLGDDIYNNESILQLNKQRKMTSKKNNKIIENCTNNDNEINDDDIILLNKFIEDDSFDLESSNSMIQTPVPDNILNKSCSHNEIKAENIKVKSNDNSTLEDIDTLINDLASGKLVLVSSEDPKDPNKIINEIYVMCNKTKELSSKPLNLPEEIVNFISSEIE